jgi:RNA-directed DNA polymerase
VRRIRAAVKNVEPLAKEANYRTTHSYRHDFNRCMGRVNKLARVGHLQHKKLIRRLKSVQPLPSRRDIERVGVMIERLKKDHPAKVDTYWYSRRFYLAHERLNLIKRTFPSAAAVMRASLKGLMPTYD